MIHEHTCHLHPEAMTSPPFSCKVGTRLTRTTTQSLPDSLDDKFWHPWSTQLSPRAFCQNISKQVEVKGVTDLCILYHFLLLPRLTRISDHGLPILSSKSHQKIPTHLPLSSE